MAELAESADAHWTQKKEEVSSSRPIEFTVWLISHLPLWFIGVLAFPISFFYFACSKRARNESRAYQNRLLRYTADRGERIKRPHVYRHIVSFALCIIEKIEGWCGKIDFNKIALQKDDVKSLIDQLDRKKGALLIGSHLGNIEMLRSLAEYGRTGVSHYVPVTAILNLNTTKKFNNTIKSINPHVQLNIINADEINAGTISLLMDRIDEGGLVVIAADRMSFNTADRAITENFLGKPARFSYGAFLLAALLKAPTYFVFAFREKTLMLTPRYSMHVHKTGIAFDCPRAEREARIKRLCREYVALLEQYCIMYPLQWYNFFNFWTENENRKEA